MRIEYTCEDGSRTLALWPSLALLHWLGRSIPHKPIEDPEPFKIYVVGSPMPSDTHPMFLTLLYAECERRWNKTPPFEVVKPGPEPKQPKDDAFHFPPGGQDYQDRCLKTRLLLVEKHKLPSLRKELALSYSVFADAQLRLGSALYA